MTGSAQRLLLVLLAAATIGATLLVTIAVMRDPGDDVVLAAGAERVDPKLPAPSFTLTDQHGQPFSSDQLAGKVWIVDFIFTRCAGTCPMMSQGMAEIQTKLKDHPRRDDIRLVSITVDPAHDRPEVLQAYAAAYDADPKRWHFLTGEREAIWRIIGQGFKEQVFEQTDDPRMPIGHSSNFVLVDREGYIRGYFDGIDSTLRDGSSDPHERDALLEKLNAVLEE